ncbi:MAG TPA: imelysin family protein [Devosia sp.]|nr:imelysin family protein [Devosia sp.]
MRLLVLFVAWVCASSAFAASALPARDITQAAIEGYVRPAFHQFAEQTAALAADIKVLCETPSEAALAAVQSDFKAAVVGYSRVEFVRIGPLTIADRMERLLFWPDRKGIALRQVQGALAEKDETAADPVTLKDKSVAMQGLVALEYLLFGTGAEQLASGDDYRCRYATASSTLIAGLADTLDKEWSDPNGQSDHMLSPQPTYDDFRTDTEVLEKLAATLIHGTETIRDQRISPILGVAEGGPKPKSALFWRSGMTVPALAANFAGLHDYFLAAKFTEAVGPTNGWIANGATFEFENAARAASDIPDPIEVAVTDEEELRALKYLVIITGSLDTLLGENLAAALGLSVGFSQLDGD